MLAGKLEALFVVKKFENQLMLLESAVHEMRHLTTSTEKIGKSDADIFVQRVVEVTNMLEADMPELESSVEKVVDWVRYMKEGIFKVSAD